MVVGSNVNIGCFDKNLSRVRDREILEILIIYIIFYSFADNEVNLSDFAKGLHITQLISMLN